MFQVASKSALKDVSAKRIIYPMRESRGETA
jgi:hypothetical protein